MNRLNLSLISIIFFCFSISVNGQKPKSPTSGEIYEDLKKFNVLASVLYVAAHPDDENTRLISYLSNHLKAQTTYLSLTRGDGGQNLIGKEFNEKLGVLRTQELLMARSIDHGKQMFTRANDFGFSKNAEETIEIWDTEKIKADVAWAIRKHKPDVIINRFDHRTSGKTHGHHTASAILSLEMYEKASMDSYAPDQLKFVDSWKAKRIFFNTSWWFYGSQENFDKADKSKLMGFDVGTYFPVLGKSNTEIAAESRSQHKCQGFGSTGTRGSQMEYLELIGGDMPSDKQNLFEGIDITWNRIKGGSDIQKKVDLAIKNFNFTNPASILPQLLEIYVAIQNLENGYWKTVKLEECKSLIKSCSGLFIEVKSNTRNGIPGNTLEIDAEIVKRLPSDVTIKSIQSDLFNIDTLLLKSLPDNEREYITFTAKLPETASYTTPYWLWQTGSTGMYNVSKQEWIGLPETPNPANVSFTCRFGNQDITFTEEVVYKYNSPENGETYRPFAIIPAVSVNLEDKVFLFPDDKTRQVQLEITTYQDSLSGKIYLDVPKGWKLSPAHIDFKAIEKGRPHKFQFSLTPPANQEVAAIHPKVVIGNKEYSDAIELIAYDHIPHQYVQQKSEAKCVRLDVQISAPKIAYIPGAGDDIGEYLQKLGFDVTILSESDLQKTQLSQYQCVISGIRAYNTIEPLKYYNKDILNYVEHGGRFVMLYNTSNSLVTPELGPYPFKISRDRVTVEGAEMRPLAPKHPILNYPNKITDVDFEHWVQERGLYFATDMDARYTAIFSSNDPGESPKEGSLIHANYGKGEFIYTGLSFFRQFPAGVPGAFRLFVNIITPSPRP